MVVDLRHLDLIVDHVGCEVPVRRHILQSLRQLMELPQRSLSEIVEIQLQRG